MTKGWRAAALCSAMMLGACGSTTLTTTGAKVPAREPTCAFEIFTSQVQGYAEIATLDVKPGAYGVHVYTDLSDFKREIAPYVCRAGGDAAIAYANGFGAYLKATVLKRVEEPAPAQAKPTTVPAWGPQQPAASEGCKFDTQCKGDRICVEGACVSPPAPEAPAGQ